MISGRSFIAVCTLAALVSSCSASRWEKPPAPAASKAPANQSMARTKRGNPPFYEVFGVRYQVLNSSANYKERGVASWYGKKFHGRLTSNGERYDMYRMTAAHKTLPLPTNVRVTNLNNGRSVIVRVNDRGPFVKNRLIDMSYEAARALDMLNDGTALVEVEALTTEYTGAISTVAAMQPAAAGPAPTAASPAPPRMYVQVGAFGEANNARNLASRLTEQGVAQVSVQLPGEPAADLYRVRIGPFTSISDYDRIVAQVETLQITNPHLVVEDDSAAGDTSAPN